MNRGSARFFLAISLVSVSTLIYEIGLTRIFSISQGYHFAFMVISIALLGIGAGGAFMTVAGGRWSVVGDHKMPIHLSTLSALFSIVAVLSFLAANQIIFDPVKAAWSRVEFLKILAQYLILSIPFVISGMILSVAYRSMHKMVHRLYLADMAGAGVGCLLVLYIFSKSGGEGVVTASAVLSLIASLLFLSSSTLKGKSLLIPIVAKVVLLIAILGSSQFLEIRMSPYRELSSVLNFPGARVVDTILSPSGKMDPEGDLSFLRHLPSSLPYRLRRGGDVFVIDPGGGMEALSAIENGAKDVWGSETRGIVVSAMKGELSPLSGNLFNRINIGQGYGRDLLKKSGRLFDIIQLPLTDTLGSSSSGIMGLQEEYNLTVEAFSEYFRHLKKDGFVAATIYLLPPPRQELKLLSTVVEAIETSSPSKQKAANRIIAIRSWGVLTILAKNGAITESDIAAVKEFCEEERFDLVWYPGIGEDETNQYNRFSESLYHREFRSILEGDRERFYRDYIFDVTPATDDR
ncbi:MAG: hypothetical protein HW415_1442, partial [Deltaproteobacteria bacterium]|nr:hypothetical protein [Deltaproteobacteria bacterium]